MFYSKCFFSSFFFVVEKNVVSPDVCPSIRPSVRLSVHPSVVEISLERVSKRSAEPIDLKIGLNMGVEIWK